MEQGNHAIRNSSCASAGLFLLWLSAASFAFLGVYTPSVAKRAAVLAAVFAVLIFLFRKKLDLSYVFKAEREDTAYYIFAALICFALFIFAAKYWDDGAFRAFAVSHIPFPIDSGVAVVAAAAGFSLASYLFVAYAVKYLLRDFLGISKEYLAKYKPYIKPCLILLVILCFAAITIFRANYVYKDDMTRIVSGTTVYTRESRNLAELVLSFLEADTYFADITPLTQIAELAAMAVSAVIVFIVFAGEKKVGAMDIAAMIPFCFSPLFLECIAFKYDAPQHGLAVLFAVLPLLRYKDEQKKYIVSIALCVLFSCACHQVAMTVFPAGVIILCVINRSLGRQSDKELFTLIRSSVIGYGAGLLLYKILIMRPIGYNTELTTVLSLSNLIPGMLKNYRTFFGCLYDWYKPLWIVLITILCVGFYVLYTFRSVRSRASSALLNAGACILLVALSNSLYPLLEGPLHSQRHMYSFGVFVGMAVIAVVCVVDVRGILMKSCAVLLSWCFIVFGIKFGNLLAYQADYTDYRVQMVIDYLSTMPVFSEEESVIVQIKGTTGYSPTVAALPENDRLMRKLVTTSFDEYFGLWNANDLVTLYGLNAVNVLDEDFAALDLPEVTDNYYYTIYADGRKVLIELKDRSGCTWMDYNWEED